MNENVNITRENAFRMVQCRKAKVKSFSEGWNVVAPGIKIAHSPLLVRNCSELKGRLLWVAGKSVHIEISLKSINYKISSPHISNNTTIIIPTPDYIKGMKLHFNIILIRTEFKEIMGCARMWKLQQLIIIQMMRTQRMLQQFSYFHENWELSIGIFQNNHKLLRHKKTYPLHFHFLVLVPRFGFFPLRKLSKPKKVLWM